LFGLLATGALTRGDDRQLDRLEETFTMPRWPVTRLGLPAG
jgi:hypothetical protein